MRKTVGILLCILLAFSLSSSLTAQSNQEELDQKELMKQFTGNWITSFPDGPVMKFHVKPLGDGYELELIWEREGELDHIDRGVMGLTSDNSVSEAWIWSNTGLVTCDYGKFTSENFFTSDRYDSLNGKVSNRYTFEFIEPGKMKMIHKHWNLDVSPEMAGQSEFIWTKE
jgi:hypothetical protein